MSDDYNAIITADDANAVINDKLKKTFDGRIVRIGLSGLPYEMHYKLGKLVQRAADNLCRKIVYVASGDLSHKLQEYGPYGFAKEGPEYDARIMDITELPYAVKKLMGTSKNPI